MNPLEYMVVDLEPRSKSREFMTERVDAIVRRGAYYDVYFTRGKVYRYRRERLAYMTNPQEIDVSTRGLFIDNRRVKEVSRILQFTHRSQTFYYIIFSSARKAMACRSTDVYVTKTPLDRLEKGIWGYLNHVAKEIGLPASVLKALDVDTGSPVNILQWMYKRVDMTRDNVPLAQYLGSKVSLKQYRPRDIIIYPFGCNESQKQAVELALTNQVSIIQGPPGTGKTQTILNIIANLLLSNKTVLVVSNNNSAVENVLEKLSKPDIGLGFLVAQLGNRANRQNFVANQPKRPDLTGWQLPRRSMAVMQMRKALQTLSHCFSLQKRRATLLAEKASLETESRYDKQLRAGVNIDKVRFKDSKQLLSLLVHLQQLYEAGTTPGFLFKLGMCWRYGVKSLALLKHNPADVIAAMEHAYYAMRMAEIDSELNAIASFLHSKNVDKLSHELADESLNLLKHSIHERFKRTVRPHYSTSQIVTRTRNFEREYPIVLSTTYSAKVCINETQVFDYVIMDEASQVDIATGALALSCGANIVIVGDNQQLPNVVDNESRKALQALESLYDVEDKYKASQHSFLSSCCEVFANAPTTLLREHYRCHPKIIEFCNKKFYDGQLIAMTSGSEDEHVIQVITTVPGNHARDHYNQREIDVIAREVMPTLADCDSVGIITPYRHQAAAINEALMRNIASTVHKYQGRECDAIVMSLVDNAPTSFSDDPNLLNVAISRAKNRLCVVTTGNEIPEDSIIAQLIAYVRYNNMEVIGSKVQSVFDMLYQQYTMQRLEIEAHMTKVSEYITENLIYNLLQEGLHATRLTAIGVLCHYPLSRLIGEAAVLNEEEQQFAHHPMSHVDFLLYNTITKRPMAAIEVDGWQYHQQSEAQQRRDSLKNSIFAKIGLPLQRLSTVQVVNIDTIVALLQACNGRKEA